MVFLSNRSKPCRHAAETDYTNLFVSLLFFVVLRSCLLVWSDAIGKFARQVV